MSERVQEARGEVRDNFERLDAKADQMGSGADRVRVERQVASLKAEAVSLMGPQERQMRDYQQRDTSGRYEGMAGAETGPQGQEAQQRAEAQVRQVAERYGVNADAAVERHSGGTPSVGLARQYAAGEVREREQSRADRGDREETPAQRDAELTKMHNEIGAIYRDAREQAAGRDRAEAREATGGEGRSTDSASESEAQRQAEGDRAAEQREAAEAARRAQEEARQNAVQRARQERAESETDQWIREREAREARDRDGGRGV